MKDSLNICL